MTTADKTAMTTADKLAAVVAKWTEFAEYAWGPDHQKWPMSVVDFDEEMQSLAELQQVQGLTEKQAMRETIVDTAKVYRPTLQKISSGDFGYSECVRLAKAALLSAPTQAELKGN